MKEILVSFDTANLAKEKGFDIKVKNWYDQTETLNPCKGIRGAMCYENAGYAPTQSLLQKWLREIHNISIKVDDFYTNSKLRFDYNICELGSQEDTPVGIFETYEKALEIGLQEALKLIPNK